MTRHVIARTLHDGPVVLRSCETEREQRSAYRAALATFREGGFDRDVVGIEMESGGATDTQSVAMEPEVVSGSGYKQGELDFAEGFSR